MRACAKCFAASTWVSNASPPHPSPGTCNFGHGYDSNTWATTVWIDSFVKLFELYEIEDQPGRGLELHIQVQQDWRIFNFEEPEKLRAFLASAVEGEHPLMVAGTRVRLKTTDDVATDHLLSWAQFSDEIRTRNRYFPQTVPDQEVLERVLLASVERIQKDIPLYRARVINSDSDPTPEEMGAPPPPNASAGRANPVGIPYLYLSFALETCIYETRVANHTRVAIGTFYPVRDLDVLNLADIKPPEFFDVAEVDAVAEQIRRISFHRYLSALGHELRKPVRASDEPTDYIPTQYLCELAKSLRLDGVLYSSSLHGEGRNLVLFDVDAAKCEPPTVVAEITALWAEWQLVT